MSAVQEMRDVTAEFPVLRREFDGRPVVYLDSSATSLTPTPVIDAVALAVKIVSSSVDPNHRAICPRAPSNCSVASTASG